MVCEDVWKADVGGSNVANWQKCQVSKTIVNRMPLGQSGKFIHKNGGIGRKTPNLDSKATVVTPG